MNFPLPQPILCPELIGRETHLAMMTRTLTQADGAHTLLVSGEAGRGKSRLTAEFKTLTHAQGWRILQGACFEDERALPYAPITEWLRAVGGPFPAEFAPLLPELGSPREYDKYRLFFSLAQFFAEFAVPHPLLLILEDLHWIDEASLELLLALIRRLDTHPVRFLLTFRSDEIHPELAHFLAQLDRERRAVEIRLAPLTRAEVDGMVQAIFRQSHPTRAEFLDALYPLTEGNPFYIEETLKSLLMAGDITVTEDGIWAEGALRDLPIPRSVQAAVQQRRERLTAPARDLLTLAAVAGRRFDFTLLEHLTGYDEMTVLNLIKELLAAQFIIEETADQFAFRHALTREAVYTILLARERRALHRTIAHALETLPGDRTQRLNDLAYHCYQGNDWPKTLNYAREAGERAQKLYAPRTAIEYFSHALEAVTHLGDPAEGHLHFLRGQAHMSLNSFEAAQKDYLTALDHARGQHTAQAEWETLLALGDLWATRDYVRAGEYFQEALSLVRTLDDPAAVGYTLNHMGNWRMNQELPFAALRDHQEALTIFQSLSDTRGIAQTLDFLGVTSFNCSDLVQARHYYQQGLPLMEQLGDQRGVMHIVSGLSLIIEFDLDYDAIHVDEAVDWGKRSVQVAREIGWQSGEALSLICLGLAYRQQGDYGQTLATLYRALEIAIEIEHNSWLADSNRALGAFYLDLLHLDKAGNHLEQALTIARELNSPIWIRQSIAALVSVYIHLQNFETAQALLEGVWQADMPMQGMQNRFLWVARIELALAMGELQQALKWLDRLIVSTANLDPQPLKPAPRGEKIVPRLWHLRGQILAALRRYPDAEQSLHAALDTATQQGRKGRQLEILRDLAAVLLAQNRPEETEQTLNAARQIITELAATLKHSTPDLAEHFTTHALSSLPVISTASTEQTLKQQFGGLTAREREIAALVGQGKTNREIAETLILSERTAERHIANIMLKLNFNTRAQIAVWVVEKRLSQ